VRQEVVGFHFAAIQEYEYASLYLCLIIWLVELFGNLNNLTVGSNSLYDIHITLFTWDMFTLIVQCGNAVAED
jgi:hypothetical protein